MFRIQFMIKPGIFAHLSPFRKLLLLTLLALMSFFLFLVAGWLSAFLIFDDFLALLDRAGNYDDPEVINMLKYMQIIGQLGLFVIPPIVFAYLDGGNIMAYLRLNSVPGMQVFALSVMMVFVVLPFIHWTALINEMLRLPEWLSWLEEWMRRSEESAMEVTEAFLATGSIQAFAINMFMIALLPAIGEELLFRGVIQRQLHSWIKNPHLAVIITAIIFSALHFQFYGFLPRTILGILFGYVFVITKSLWVPIMMHLINNGAAVIAAFLFRNDLLQRDYQEVGKVSEPIWIIGSLLMTILLLTAVVHISRAKAAHE